MNNKNKIESILSILGQTLFIFLFSPHFTLFSSFSSIDFVLLNDFQLFVYLLSANTDVKNVHRTDILRANL